MSAISDYLEARIINFWLRGTSYTPPAAVYLALFTTPTTDAGGGTEVTGGSYARQAVTFSAPGASDGLTTNTGVLTYPGMPACTVLAGGVFDALTGGNMLVHGLFSAARIVGVGKSFVVGIGEATFVIR